MVCKKKYKLVKTNKSMKVKINKVFDKKTSIKKHKKVSIFKSIFAYIGSIFLGLFSRKSNTSKDLKVSVKKTNLIEKNIDEINNNVNNVTSINELNTLDSKLQSDKEEYKNEAKKQDDIVRTNKSINKKVINEINDKNVIIPKKIMIVESKIENKKNVFKTEEKKMLEIDNINKNLSDLNSKIMEAGDLYLLYNYEYDVADLENKVNDMNNIVLKESLDELKIKLENRIDLKQREQLGYRVYENNQIDDESVIKNYDINRLKDMLDSDILSKERQIKSLDSGSINYHKNSFHLIDRLSNTILNISLGLISFSWFKSKIVSKLIGSIFIFNGIREIRNIINPSSKKDYIDFKNIEASLKSTELCLEKNNEIILNIVEEIELLKEELLNNYYDLKETDEFIKIFESIDKIELSIKEKNRKIIKSKENVSKIKKMVS